MSEPISVPSQVFDFWKKEAQDSFGDRRTLTSGRVIDFNHVTPDKVSVNLDQGENKQVLSLGNTDNQTLHFFPQKSWLPTFGVKNHYCNYSSEFLKH